MMMMMIMMITNTAKLCIAAAAAAEEERISTPITMNHTQANNMQCMYWYLKPMKIIPQNRCFQNQIKIKQKPDCRSE